MSNKENVEIISARPEDADFIAWIVAQGMHMDGVPSFLKFDLVDVYIVLDI